MGCWLGTGDPYRAPETWTRQAYRNLVYFHEVDKGGHFAAWEEPLPSTEITRRTLAEVGPPAVARLIRAINRPGARPRTSFVSRMPPP